MNTTLSEKPAILSTSKSRNSAETKHFGHKVFNELLEPPWMHKDIENVSKAWAFVKVSEMIAGRLITSLLPGETAEFYVKNVSKIYLEVFQPNENRYVI